MQEIAKRKIEKIEKKEINDYMYYRFAIIMRSYMYICIMIELNGYHSNENL